MVPARPSQGRHRQLLPALAMRQDGRVDQHLVGRARVEDSLQAARVRQDRRVRANEVTLFSCVRHAVQRIPLCAVHHASRSLHRRLVT